MVGAGFAGIAAAAALMRARPQSSARGGVLVVERASSVGGTWQANSYPGVACDVPSHLYGLAAHPNPGWSGVYAAGHEIREYLEAVADAEGITPERGTLRLGQTLTHAHWQAEAGRWRVTLRSGSASGAGSREHTLTATSLVLACGRLTEPALPAVPGLDGFTGAVMHTAAWQHDTPLDGLRVAVIGTGASAVQLVPELARRSRVTVFQRTPAWILPRGARSYTAAERAEFAAEPAAVRERLRLEADGGYAARSGEPAASALARDRALAHLAAQVPQGALREALTPGYAFGCKRVLLSDDFYPTLASGAALLETSALASVEGQTLIAASGARHEVDAVVFATGFASTRQPYAEIVMGEGGLSLAAHWAGVGGMRAFASTVVAGFPNLFVLNGPNASLGHSSSVLMIEEQVGYMVRALAARDRAGGAPLRVRADAEAAYAAEIDAAAATTPWLVGGCRNWYVDPDSGRLALLWPGTAAAFAERLARADGAEFEGAEFDGAEFDGAEFEGAPASLLPEPGLVSG